MVPGTRPDPGLRIAVVSAPRSKVAPASLKPVRKVFVASRYASDVLGVGYLARVPQFKGWWWSNLGNTKP